MANMIEKPGAQTPWDKVNQLLATDERFEVISASGKNFLLAPKHVSQLTSLLSFLHQEGINISVQGRNSCEIIPTDNSIIISVRAFSQIIWHEQGIVEVGAGCTLSSLHPFLFERKHEVALEGNPLASSKRSVASLLLSGHTSGIRYKLEGTPENILGIEFVTLEGHQIKLGGSLAGPTLHKLMWGLQTLPGIIVKIILKTYPIPPARLRLAWSFRQKEALWKHLHDLKRFALSWEYLDVVLSGRATDQGFIFAQISGLPDEMKAFAKHCPSYDTLCQQDKLQLINFLLQQNLRAFPVAYDYALQAGEYLWIQDGNQKAWWLAEHRNQNIHYTEPVWKNRFRKSLNE